MAKTTKPSPPATSWLDSFKAALSKVRAAQEDATTELVRGRKRPRSPQNWTAFWFAVEGLVHTIIQRPMPGKFAKCDAYALELAGHVQKAYEAVIEEGKSLASLGWSGTITSVDGLEATVNGIENPPPRRLLREDPKTIAALPGMSKEQFLRMFPHLTEEQLFAHQSNPDAFPFPEPPPAAPPVEAPPVVAIRADILEITRRLPELRERVMDYVDAEVAPDVDYFDQLTPEVVAAQ